MQPDGQEKSGRPWERAVDVHHHILPDFYTEELEKMGVRTMVSGIKRPSWNAGRSLAMMDRQGIRAAVVCVWPGVPPMLEEKAAAGFARWVNEYLAELVAAHPGWFGAFATLPFPHMDAVLEEFRYAVGPLGLDGVGLISNYAGVYVGDPSMDPLFAELDRRRTPVFVHPTAPPYGDQATAGLPLPLFEFPFESVRVAAQLLYNGVLDRFPDLRLILPHGGGGVPYYAGRLAAGADITPTLADRLPADPVGSLRRLYFDTAMVGDRLALAALRAFAAPDRVLVGSDFPAMPEPYIRGAGHHVVANAEFTTEEKKRVDHENALELFPRFNKDGE